METVLPQDQIRMEEPMSRHTTFGIGGPAECFITVDTPGQLAKIFVYLQRTGWDFFLLGNGSNLLVGDKGYRGVVIRLGEGFSRIRVQGERLTAGAGAPLGSAAKEALSAGLTGLEFASGIPGTVGGAVRMNAGAYGGEMSGVVETVDVMGMDGEILTLDNETMEFSYRSSAIKNRPYAVLSTTLRLKPGNREEIGERYMAWLEKGAAHD